VHIGQPQLISVAFLLRALNASVVSYWTRCSEETTYGAAENAIGSKVSPTHHGRRDVDFSDLLVDLIH